MILRVTAFSKKKEKENFSSSTGSYIIKALLKNKVGKFKSFPTECRERECLYFEVYVLIKQSYFKN